MVIDYSVDGDGNPRDYYNFQLGESAEVSLSLRKLDFNADLFLEDKYGNVLASSENKGTVNEDIVATLPVGNDYHIRVEALEPGQNDYRLRIVSTEPNDATLVTSAGGNVAGHSHPHADGDRGRGNADHRTRTAGRAVDLATAGAVQQCPGTDRPRFSRRCHDHG